MSFASSDQRRQREAKFGRVATFEPVRKRKFEGEHEKRAPKRRHPKSSRKEPRTRIENCAYCTLVMIGDEYIPGALVLAYSLRLVGTKAKLVVMVTPDVSADGKKRLACLFDDVIDVDYIECKSHQKRWKRFEGMYDWIDKSFTKFNMLNLTQYDKVIQLDADMIALKNPDELFQLPTPAGICTGVSGKREEVVQKELKWHGKRMNERILEDSLKVWGIRGCLYLVEPNYRHYKEMLQELRGGHYGDRNLRPGADEQLLTNFYWEEWHHINAQYARVSYINKTELPGDPYLLHSPTIKPWSRPKTNQWKEEKWMDINIWCELAVKLIDEHPDAAGAFNEGWISEARDELFLGQTALQMYNTMREEWKFQNETFTSPVSLFPAKMRDVPEKVVWMFWDKPKIPPLVEMCRETFEMKNPGWKVIVVHPKNIFDYLYRTDLPELWEKFARPAHQSDAARVSLLCRYGGVYTDATVVCLKPLDEIWEKLSGEKRFWGFMYEGRPKNHRERMCCWFMAAKKPFHVMYEWKQEIHRLMSGRTSTRKFHPNPAKSYVALGPPIIDPLVDRFPNHFILHDPIENSLIDLDNVTWFLAPLKDQGIQERFYKNNVWKMFRCGGESIKWSRDQIMSSKSFLGEVMRKIFAKGADEEMVGDVGSIFETKEVVVSTSTDSKI